MGDAEMYLQCNAVPGKHGACSVNDDDGCVCSMMMMAVFAPMLFLAGQMTPGKDHVAMPRTIYLKNCHRAIPAQQGCALQPT